MVSFEEIYSDVNGFVFQKDARLLVSVHKKSKSVIELFKILHQDILT